MKKLLNLIGTIAILGGTATSVVACSSSPDNHKSSKSAAQQIIDKITDKIVVIDFNANLDANAELNTTNINTVLKSENPSLTADDISHLTYTGTLDPGHTVTIAVTAEVKATKYATDLQITMKESAAQQILDKITDKNITVPAGTNPDVTNSATVNALNTALEKANPTLTANDLKALSYSGGPLVPGEKATSITVTATIGAQTAKGTIKVFLPDTAQQIIDKITNKNITIPAGTNPDVTNPATVTALNTALQKANKSLTNADLQKLSYTGGPLVPGSKPTSITVTATVKKTATTKLQVTMPQTDQQKADAIKEKIADPDLTIPANTKSQSVADNKTAITTALKTDNPTLTDDDIATMTFSKGTFKPGTALPVTATITVGKAKATKTLQVTMAKTDQQKADAIKEKIADSNLTIPNNASSKTVADNTTAIKTALKKNNTTLTDDDLAKITFSAGTFTPGTALPVTATITVGTAKATKALQVTMEKSAAQQIIDKIKKTAISLPGGNNPNVDNGQTTSAIKTTLQKENPTLTANDLKKITFSNDLLKINQAVSVTATAAAGGSTAKVTLQVTLQDLTWTRSAAKGIPVGSLSNSSPKEINGIYYLSTNNGIYTSTDGVNWDQQSAKGIPTDATAWSSLTKWGKTYYLGTFGNGLYTSTDGINWDRKSAQYIPTSVATYNSPTEINGDYYLGTYGSGLYYTTDGTTWTQSVGQGLPPKAKFYKAQPVEIDGTYYLGTDGNGLYTSTNGRYWDRNSALGIPYNISIYTSPIKIDGDYYLGTYGSGLYTSTDGINWTQSSSINSKATIYDQPTKINGTYYLGTDNDGLYTSTNGTVWTKLTGGIPPNTNARSHPVRINDIYYWGTNKGLYVSTDGNTWTQVSTKEIPTATLITAPPVEINGIYYIVTSNKGVYTATAPL